MCEFLDAEGQLTLLPSLAEFELIQDIMHFLVTCKFTKDQINSNRVKVKALIIIYSLAAMSVVSCRIWLKFKLITAFMHALILCKNEEYTIKNDGASVTTTFLRL